MATGLCGHSTAPKGPGELVAICRDRSGGSVSRQDPAGRAGSRCPTCPRPRCKGLVSDTCQERWMDRRTDPQHLRLSCLGIIVPVKFSIYSHFCS